jgi:hypothetical protein
MQDIGRIVIVAGAIVVAVGVVLYMGWGTMLFGWMGRLPGDIRIERDNSRFYFPIVTCIVLSLVLSLVIRIVFWIKGGH